MATTSTKKKTTSKTPSRYIESVGRRKNAVARVRIVPGGKGEVVVNEKKHTQYFPTDILRKTAVQSFDITDTQKKFDVSAKVHGGGIAAQAEAVRLGIARSLLKHDENLRGNLKDAGHLKRDPRKKERYHFGKKKARKAPQWSKR